MAKCECDIRTKLVGDGCRVCNPSLALEYADETIRELRAVNADLLAALEPFAKLDIADLDGNPDDYPVYGRNASLIRCGDVRKARDAIACARG